MMERGWNLAFLKNVIFRIPGKDEKGMIRYLRKDREDGPDVLPFQGMEYILNVFKS
jgi:hypothetical protein